jgi:hypothetical protein
MTRAWIALAGVLTLVIGVAAFGWATRTSKFGSLQPPGVYPSILDIQIPDSRAEFAGLLEFGTPNCPKILGRVQANMSADRFFPIAYGLCLLAIAYFAATSPFGKATPRAARIFGWLAAVSVLATILFDYRENRLTNANLVGACANVPSWADIAAMRAASLDKWAALGVTLLLIGVTNLLALSPGVPFRTFTSIRILAALIVGVSGIGAWALDVRRLAEFEFSGVGVVALATLWQALARLSRPEVP